MTHTETSFSPAEHGFRFVNRFQLPLLKLPLPFAGELDLSQVVFGLCGGMCFAALDYFYMKAARPGYSRVDELDRNLFTYLYERQIDSLKLPVLLKVIEWMLSEDETIAARISRYEFPKLRRMMDRGEPAVLALIRTQRLDEITHNHQVLAYGYEFDPDTRELRITLYDPNHPGEKPVLTLNLSDPRGGIGIAQSTGEALRGFFVIPYKPQKNIPRQAPRAEARAAFALESAGGLRLHWPVDSRRVNQYFGENPDTYKPFGLPGHEGLDLFALSGGNIYAATDGEVYQVEHPRGHPYGLQVRIKHEVDGRKFSTVYAHLSETFVEKGQQVSAGERIALADNTGNSFGSHLHLTLKIDGEQTPGYPSGIVDPYPYLREASGPPVEPLPVFSGLTVYTTAGLNLRAAPNTDARILALLPAGEALAVLGEADEAREKIGVEGEWLQVQTAGGQAGYVAAAYVLDLQGALPPSDLVVFAHEAVNLRSGPGTAFHLLATLTSDDPLTVLGNERLALSKLGRQGEWLQISTGRGERGFVAAWLVHRTGQSPPASGLVVHPLDLLNVRARPSTEANILTVVTPADPLVVLGEAGQARANLGQQDRWLNVRTPARYNGYVAAWLVRPAGEVPPQPGPNGLTVYPTSDLNLRAQPSINSPRLGGAVRNEALAVVETDLDAVRGKIGKDGAWIHVQGQDGRRGWAAAWFLSATPV